MPARSVVVVPLQAVEASAAPLRHLGHRTGHDGGNRQERAGRGSRAEPQNRPPRPRIRSVAEHEVVDLGVVVAELLASPRRCSALMYRAKRAPVSRRCWARRSSTRYRHGP